jgi:hypothetical protein
VVDFVPLSLFLSHPSLRSLILSHALFMSLFYQSRYHLEIGTHLRVERLRETVSAGLGASVEHGARHRSGTTSSMLFGWTLSDPQVGFFVLLERRERERGEKRREIDRR